MSISTIALVLFSAIWGVALAIFGWNADPIEWSGWALLIAWGIKFGVNPQELVEIIADHDHSSCD